MQDRARSLLAARAAQLREQMDALRAPEGELTRAALARCLGESEPIVVGQQTAGTAHAALQGQLEQVRHAQRRLDEGRYGVCEECGQPIPEERLQARPWSTRCVRHG
jgi:DnaK suppressor protein